MNCAQSPPKIYTPCRKEMQYVFSVLDGVSFVWGP